MNKPLTSQLTCKKAGSHNRLRIRPTKWLTLVGFVVFALFATLHTAVAAGSEKGGVTPLQSIIDKAAPGEIIVLEKGRYSGPVLIEKPLTLQGGAGVSIINESKSSAIYIRADGVKLKGLSVEHRGNEPSAAVRIKGKHSEITDLSIRTRGFGLLLYNANDTIIRNNRLVWGGSNSASSSQKGNGIDVYNSHNILIEANEVRGMRDGIYLEKSSFAMVRDNKLIRTRYGIHSMYIDGSSIMNNIGEENMTGAMIMGVKDVKVSGNVFRKQSAHVHSQGILLYDVHQSFVRNNVVDGNRVGMNIAESSDNEIQDNSILRNFIGIQMVQAEGNVFTHNRFISNVIEASAVNSQDNRLSKNYWDTFQGLDLNQDGFSEIAYAMNPFYEQLVSRNSAYQLFFQSPGMVFLSELHTEGREQWTTDKSPLMSIGLDERQPSNGSGGIEVVKQESMVWIIGLSLLILAISMIIYMGVWRK